MKRIKHLKNLEITLILALLAIGMLFPWHSSLLGSNSAVMQPSDSYKVAEDGLLAKHSTFPQPEQQEPDFTPSISQGNTVLSLSQIPEEETRKINVVVTAYSSTPDQTSGDPYTTAAGTRVREGIVANNALPFGTKIRIPELYGDQIFVVEDRLHWRKGNYHVDIWFPTREGAIEFGSKRTHIEVIES